MKLIHHLKLLLKILETSDFSPKFIEISEKRRKSLLHNPFFMLTNNLSHRYRASYSSRDIRAYLEDKRYGLRPRVPLTTSPSPLPTPALARHARSMQMVPRRTLHQTRPTEPKAEPGFCKQKPPGACPGCISRTCIFAPRSAGFRSLANDAVCKIHDFPPLISWSLLEGDGRHFGVREPVCLPFGFP